MPNDDRQEHRSRWSESVPQHLLSEDRREYERILDEALRSAPHRLEPTAVGQRLTPEQLRTMALNATALITAAAATEYHHYVKVREELRQPAPSTPSSVREAGHGDPNSDATGLATTMGEIGKTGGAGVGAVVAVLTPLLTGGFAVLSLLAGFILKTLTPKSAFAHMFLTIGWISGAVAAAAILIGAIGLLLTALRDASVAAGPHRQLAEEVAQARHAWQEALLERGILPFLREALDLPGTAPPRRTASQEPASLMPRLGYNRPGFSSPDDGDSSPHPSFTSPDFGPAESTPSTGPEHSD
ncbi:MULTISPECIES: hypothetical protein [unclassified Streptomyces]|uniref:hypothetical protein n=1 Tax=unclassified Streptomyces TaxID=2593676 RepID=UPI0040427630